MSNADLTRTSTGSSGLRHAFMFRRDAHRRTNHRPQDARDRRPVARSHIARPPPRPATGAWPATSPRSDSSANSRPHVQRRNDGSVNS